MVYNDFLLVRLMTSFTQTFQMATASLTEYRLLYNISMLFALLSLRFGLNPISFPFLELDSTTFWNLVEFYSSISEQINDLPVRMLRDFVVERFLVPLVTTSSGLRSLRSYLAAFINPEVLET